MAHHFSQRTTLYVIAQGIMGAVKSVNGVAENTARFIAAARKAKVADSPAGPVELDETANPIHNVYIKNVERVGGAAEHRHLHVPASLAVLEVQQRGVPEGHSLRPELPALPLLPVDGR